MSNSTKLQMKSEDSINPNTYGRELYAEWHGRFIEKMYSHAQAANHSIAVYTLAENIYASYGAKKNTAEQRQKDCNLLRIPQ